MDYLQHYFLHYFVKVAGIVTGMARKGPAGTDTRKELEKRLSEKYTSTVHIDDEAVICTAAGQYGFRAYQLDARDDDWKEKILERAEQIRRIEHFDHPEE